MQTESHTYGSWLRLPLKRFRGLSLGSQLAIIAVIATITGFGAAGMAADPSLRNAGARWSTDIVARFELGRDSWSEARKYREGAQSVPMQATRIASSRRTQSVPGYRALDPYEPARKRQRYFAQGFDYASIAASWESELAPLEEENFLWSSNQIERENRAPVRLSRGNGAAPVDRHVENTPSSGIRVADLPKPVVVTSIPQIKVEPIVLTQD